MISATSSIPVETNSIIAMAQKAKEGLKQGMTPKAQHTYFFFGWKILFIDKVVSLLEPAL